MSEYKEKRKEAILDAALALFLEKSYASTKIIDIANAAGIGKGTVYEYFDSKEALLLELLNTKVLQDYMRAPDVVTAPASYREKLEAYLYFEIECTEKYKGNVTDFKQQFLGNTNETALAIVQAIFNIVHLQFECVLKIITEGIASGEFRPIEPRIATTCIMGATAFFMSLLHQAPQSHEFVRCSQFKPTYFENQENTLLDFFFNGLLA